MSSKVEKGCGTSVELSDNDIEGLTGPSGEQVEKMRENGRKVMVIGRLKNGKVELDQLRLDELGRKFPKANMAFVAVNAPFDPVPS